jgi:hypothetical protein
MWYYRAILTRNLALYPPGLQDQNAKFRRRTMRNLRVPGDKLEPSLTKPNQLTTISERKLKANGENAKKATSPRTARGKAYSRRNAIKPGLFVQSSEEPEKLAKVEVLPDPVRRFLQKDEWQPAYPAQEAALDTEADLLLFGGSAGSLKTATALVSLIQERDHGARMSSYFFRKTYDAMEQAMTIAGELFPQTGARSVDRHKGLVTTWMWPTGATFRFRQLNNEADLANNWGKEMSRIAFDESTQWEEKYPRTILSRNRSPDSSLQLHAIFTTNPGNTGAKWHMRLWMNGVCPHCEPEKAPPQGVLRWDARWPEIDRPLEGPDGKYKLSTAYILGSIQGHNKLGQDYVAKLHMQSPALAKALLAGCWEATEGQFFDIWDYASMTVDRHQIGEQWWWPQWPSCDYGFSVSAPAAGLFRHAPPSDSCRRGVVYLVDELGGHDARDKTARGVAQAIVKRWISEGEIDPSKLPERRWMPWYLSPDAWSEHGKAGGVSFNLANQINEILAPCHLGFSQAKNDRVGGAMKLYSGLKDGELKICRNCVKTIEALQSRKKDPDREGDVLKVPGDELDDFYDMLRYGYYSWATVRDAQKPRETEIEETLADRWKVDPTSAMILHQQMQQELKKQPHFHFYSNTARMRMRLRMFETRAF